MNTKNPSNMIHQCEKPVKECHIKQIAEAHNKLVGLHFELQEFVFKLYDYIKY